MNVMIFDTETTDLNSPFCYDVGYLIANAETEEILVRRHYIVEQVWHNLPLFESAYYKDKRQQYVSLMRSRQAILDKWGYIMRQLSKDIRNYSVAMAYAYNSDFDEKVMNFNNNWFKTINPFETIPIFDIWAMATNFITNRADYQQFCEEHKFFSDTGNYKSSAEVVYRFITNNPDFVEAHMGVFDGDIEAAILFHCVKVLGAEFGKAYKLNKVCKRDVPTPFTIKVNNNILFDGEYKKKYVRNNVYNFTVEKE